MVSNLYKQMAVGAGWMTAFTVLNRFQGLISTVILARLLIPEDFGIVAMSMSMIAAVELLAALGLHVVLVQHPDPKEYHFDTAQTLNVCLAILSATIVFVLAYPSATFFNEPRLEDVIYVLSVSVLLRGFENIRIVWFQKRLQFKRDFLLRFVPRFFGFCVTIPLAYYMQSYWALIAGMVTSTAIGVVYSYLLIPVLPKPSLSGVKEFFNFSKWLFLSNLLSYGIQRGQDVIIGRTLGATGLGTYTLSNELATLPSSQLTAPINRAVLPGYSKMSHDLEMLRKGFFDVTSVMCLIAMPAAIGVAAIADILVEVVLGQKWSHASPLVELLAVNGAIGVFFANISPLFNSLARPKLFTYLQILSVIILLPSLYYFSTQVGIIGVGWAVLLTTSISAPVSILVTKNILQSNIYSFWAILWRPLFSVVAMYFTVRLYIDRIENFSLFALVLSVAIGAVSYLLCVVSLWLIVGKPKGAEHVVASYIRKKVLDR